MWLVALTLATASAETSILPPTVRWEEGGTRSASGLPLYGVSRFLPLTGAVNGKWRSTRAVSTSELSMSPRTPEVLRQLETEIVGATTPEFDDSSWAEAEVPSVASAPPETFEGVTWYRTRFDATPVEGRALLRFEGAGYVTDVWLNGTWLGWHEGTWTPFTFDVTDLLAERNTLAVRTAMIPQGSRNDVVPYAKCDFWNYGGIIRDVSLATVPETHLADLRCLGDADGNLRARVTIRAAGAGWSGPVRIEVLGPYCDETVPWWQWRLPEQPVATAETSIGLSAGEISEAEVALHIPNVAPWSPPRPALYLVRASIAGDRLVAQTGFRTIATAPGGKLLLNGEPVRLLGAARHEEMPGRWQAVAWSDWSAVRGDLERLRNLGCDFVRLGHYPCHPMSAMLCDQLGLATWEEVPFYWFGGAEFEASLARGIAQQLWLELLQRDASSPSVLFWGVSNESGSTEERRRFNAVLKGMADAYDGTRLIGQSAVGGDPTDATHEPLDVVGMTCYWGIFYGKEPRADTARALERAAERYPDKPLIATEYGAWGGNADQGWQRWVFEETFAAFEANPHLAGTLWWAAYDYYSPRQGGEDRYHAFGLWDFSRTQKRLVADALSAAHRRVRGEP